MNQEVEIRVICRDHAADLNIPNEPFPLFGRLRVSYAENRWGWQAQRFAEADVTEMCFPDESYDFDALSKNSVFLGAYASERCVGLAILQEAMLRYMYLYDLKVNRAWRGRGVGRKLIEAAQAVSRECGYRGVYTQGQDNNLGACLFYLKNGFEIGGLDTNVYKGTKQEGKADVIFYLENAPA